MVECLGSSMQLLSIENLSLAAEVTVVLLLLSFAWPQSRTLHPPSSDSSESIGWEPVQFFFLQNGLHRGLYLNQWKQHLQSNSLPPRAFQPPYLEDNDNAKIPAPWQDRLTHLLNRQGFDAIFSAWLSVESQHRGASCVSMVTLSTYSELTGAHGAMVTEQAVQRIGKQLSADLSHDSLIARYLPDRFVILHFAASTASSQTTMAQVHSRTSADSFFQAAGKPLHLPCNISILGLESELDANAFMDLLEEGISEGERSGRAIVSRENDDWTNVDVSLDEQSTDSTLHESESQPSPSVSTAKDILESESEEPSHKPETTPPKVEHIAGSTNADNTQPASNDISAVASPDDIAALFAQINTQKSSGNASGSSPSESPTRQTKSNEATNDPVADAGEAATVDDIAALFATVKPNVKSTTPSATTQATSLASPPPSPAPTSAEIDKTEVASADDIAALFASVKPTVKPMSDVAPAASQTAKTQKSEAVKPAVDIDPNEAASADDIAALFATIKPTAKPSNDVAPVIPSAAKAKPSPPSSPIADIDPNEAASADDIAALFATVKPTAKTTVAAPPTKMKPLELTESERTESATADDIADLFATVKTAAKPATTSPPSSPPKLDSSPTPSREIPTGGELAEVATADDIAALFAAMKK